MNEHFCIVIYKGIVSTQSRVIRNIFRSQMKNAVSYKQVPTVNCPDSNFYVHYGKTPQRRT